MKKKTSADVVQSSSSSKSGHVVVCVLSVSNMVTKIVIRIWIKDEKIYINNVFMGGFVDVV